MTDSTRQSQLLRARNGDEAAWKCLSDLYRPLILDWLRRHGVAHHDAEDLTQDILLAVVKNLDGFDHAGRRGAFRSWLRTITVNRTRNFWKARGGQATAGGVRQMVEDLDDPGSELSQLWDRQHNEYVVRCLLDLVRLEFEPQTVQAFCRLAVDGASAEEVAGELGISVGAAYVAKSRVLKRIREEAEGLLE